MKLKVVLTCLLLGISQQVFAWGFRGHILVAQVAYDTLTTKQKIIANEYTEIIYKQLPKKLRRQLQSNSPGATHFAQIAVLPDLWRDLSLQDIFNQFDASLPNTLKPYANQTTESWHFINLPVKRKNCKSPYKHDIVFAINTLKKAWPHTQSKNAKAVIMVFLEHFVGDIHQPLHTISEYNNSCGNDLGGNDFPIRVGSHKTNLHALWDQGVGYFFHKFNFEKKAQKLMREYPKDDFTKILQTQNPLNWAQNNLQYGNFIYSVKPYQKIPGQYYRKGQAIVRQQVTVAGYQLAQILGGLFEKTI